MNLLAVDPGTQGGIAWLIDGASGCCSMPATEGDVWQKLLELYGKGVKIAYVERQAGFIQGAGGASVMFTFGEGYGFIKGCLTALGMRIILVQPQKWQKALSLGNVGRLKIPKEASPEVRKSLKKINDAAKRSWKNKLKEEAQRRFPHLAATLANADALLLLDYAQQAERGKK